MSFQFRGRRMRLFSGVATGVALALVSAGVANAQAPDSGQENEIIVTGFRASLRSSTETKRESDAIVESVSAEEIGKLPDNSIAESLARLPGLSAQRLFGRSQQISVRGLSPDFTTALLNGREQVSAGDNRGVEFDQYPSELLSSVVVYKTPTASLVGQGLAGTADMRTVRPLSYDERVFAVNARYEWNEVGALNAGSDDDGYRVTASYIDRSADGRWGWAIGLSTMSSPTQAERFEAWGYPTTGTGDYVLGGAKPYVQSSTLERDGVLGVLQFEPTDSFSTRIDAFYSEFDEEQTLRGIELPLAWSAATLQPGYTAQNGFVTAGTFAGVEGVVRNDVRTRNSKVSAIGWNMQFDLNDRWAVETDLSYSHVERNDLDLETYAGTGPGSGVGAADTLGFRAGNGSFVFSSVLNYADPSVMMLTDPQGWGQAGFLKKPRTDDELRALRASAERQLENGPFSSLEFGINYSERQKDKASDEAFVDLIGGNNQTVAIPAAFLQGTTSLGFLGIPGMVSYDPRALLARGNVYSLRPHQVSDVIVKTWGVEENVAVYYTQLNVDSEMWSVPVKGNVGIQFVDTEQSSTGGVETATGPQTASAGDSYLEMLPSLNLSFQLADNSYLRVGLARTLARPRMDDLRASFQVTYSPGNIANTDPSQSYWGGNGGNPRLRPWIANSFDLSYEHYLGDTGYISLAAFHKELESYVFPQNVVFDFTGFPTQNAGDTPATRLGVASVPVNGSGGYVRGLEFTASIPAEVFFPALEGFGVVFNASKTDSSIEPPNTPESKLPGLSEEVVNTTVYFERAGFEARVSNRYRSDFLGEVTGFGAGRELRIVQGESILDAQLGYRFTDGPLDGLAVQFQANNITDEPFTTVIDGDERRVKDYQRFGSTYMVGVSYRH
ncbi:MAG: TonB-dependent receptor [Hyphomonadaceae bacterium]|nr:TonB-dependent receptor [Hyphomonadaceae bacterium]